MRRASGILLCLLVAGALSGVGASQNPARGQGGRAPVQPELSRRAAKERVRVIIRLNVDTAPEARLTGPARAAQRARISTAQQSLEAALAPYPARGIKRFVTLPALAAAVDGRTLQYLATHPAVQSVQEDRVSFPTLAESTRIIGAPAVWSAGYTGTGQSIAILDSGIDRAHPFFGQRIASEACYSTTDATYGSTSLCTSATGAGSAQACSGISGCEHGTHVAGIAAGSSSSLKGVAPDASIIAVQVFSSFSPAACGTSTACLGSYDSDQIRAMERVYELRNTFSIAAVNMSLGSGRYTSTCDDAAPTVKDAIDLLRGAGIAAIVASGNGGYANALSAPSCISSAISVGSTTDGSAELQRDAPADEVSYFSNSASFLTLLAPGHTITSSVPGGRFDAAAGTSMAAPHVAGAFAVLRSQNPSATVQQMLDALVRTGSRIVDPDNNVATPRINVSQAVQALGPPCSYAISPGSASFAAGAGYGTVTVTTQTRCAWTAVIQTPGILAVTSGAARSGSGSVTYSIAANPGAARSGTLLIAGQLFTVEQRAQVVASAVRAARDDFNGDGNPDLLWHHAATGDIAVWLMDGLDRLDAVLLSPARVPDTNWRPVGTGDFDRDGQHDILWQNTNGRLFVWFMTGVSQREGAFISQALPDARWRVRSVADYDGDGDPDLILQHSTEGWIGAWLLDGTTVVDGRLAEPGIAGLDWRIAGSGDFNADGQPDLLFQREDGWLAVWLMDGLRRRDGVYLIPDRLPDARWQVTGVSDVNQDGWPDLVLRHTADGLVGAWLMDGLTRLEGALFRPSVIPDPAWTIVGPR